MELTLRARRWYDLRSIAKPAAKLEESSRLGVVDMCSELQRSWRQRLKESPLSADRIVVILRPIGDWFQSPRYADNAASLIVIEVSVDIERKL